ncbi:hypothetical protein EV200_103306 [Pedobacter psychrotolerans]|uniref:Uncharacterized protein n=1 Tax=Pedobacter psychrotolerans TaxID=1843235 RepID=A0A4R2HG32_9SPHI|nr:hypothetical protein EV200_103306 [Pedobacter psychrotolerans]
MACFKTIEVHRNEVDDKYLPANKVYNFLAHLLLKVCVSKIEH